MWNLESAQWTSSRVLFTLEACFAFIGIVTNAVLFLATFRSSALKSKCNFLIGSCALFDVIHLSGNIFGLSIWIGDGHIDSFTCSVLQFIPEIFVYAGCFCVLSIGIDRLFSVSFPVCYRNVERLKYLTVHLMLILIFASYAPFLMIKYYQPQTVICSLPEPFHGDGKYLWIQAMLIINVITLVPYALAWISLKSRDETSYTKRVFRAIALVMIFDVGGWLVAVALTKLIYCIDMPNGNRLVLQFFCGCIVHFCIAIKPIIYYSSSTEYRNVLREFLGWDSIATSHAHSSSLGFGPLFELPIFYGDGFIDSFTCSFIQVIPEIGVYAGCFCVLSIGVDRLFSITCLSAYRRIDQRAYLSIHLLIIFIFASYSPYLMLAYYKPHRVACSIPAPFHGKSQMLWSQAMIIVNFITIIPYTLTWLTIRSRQTSSYTTRIFRSLLLVMTFDVGGWLAAVVLIKAIYSLDISNGNRFVLSFLSGWFVHFGIAIKPWIYYTTSTEYRSAFRSLLFPSTTPSQQMIRPSTSKERHSHK
ncbi:hypothetical protein PRIPAC_89755 [Pristionchus pacificus]|uniref:G protein-coupled receptor n=1 Tax=Pristionchus pacificus TaxID=54126 RepID=A0A2A6CTY1_PRIPA|nr:hypothetical protein PRIPAC_89755 [Pristionchus pacificus]|eukprot:PDM81493.1 G protein-coupled receptor [Pristionchus pacificus]